MYPPAAPLELVSQLAPLLDPSREVITVIGVLALGALILLSAFFASSEIAIFSLGDPRVGTLEADQVPGARTLAGLKADPRRLLVTILVGNNIANIGMSSIATGLLGLYLDPGQSVLIATFGVTSIVLLFGESAPKSYAVEHSESWALRIARPLRSVQVLLYPLVELFDWLTKVVNSLIGSEGDFEKAYITRAEVGEVITAGERAGVLSEEEHRMLQRLLRFRNRIAKETMVPRLDVVAVSADTTVASAIDTCLESGVSQLPIYEDVLDTVVGTVHIRELVAAQNRSGSVPLRSIAREPYIVPETKDVDDLLRELRRDRRRIAVVIDEFGTTSGIVTIEDIVEEIIGEVLTQTESVPIRWLGETVALVRGELNIHTVNEALGTKLPEPGESETIAGLILDRTGRVVEEGESVTYDGVRLEVETAENNRILEVRVELGNGDADSDSPAGGE